MSIKHNVYKFASLILMLSACTSFSQSNTSTDKIVEKIQNQPSLLLNFKLTDRNINLANKLSRSATDEELIRLSGSEDDKVVCLAFLILNKRNHIAVDSIYEVNKTVREGEGPG